LPRGRGAAALSTALNSNALNVAAGLLLPAAITGLGARSGQDVLVAAWYAGLTVVTLLLECLDFAAEQSQPRVPVHRGLSVLQRARVYRVVDLVLGQPELLAGGLVAQRCALALPFFVRIVQWSILMISAARNAARRSSASLRLW
jgi:hypothetical protein